MFKFKPGKSRFAPCPQLGWIAPYVSRTVHRMHLIELMNKPLKGFGVGQLLSTQSVRTLLVANSKIKAQVRGREGDRMSVYKVEEAFLVEVAFRERGLNLDISHNQFPLLAAAVR